MKTLTITITIPDGVEVAVNGSQPAAATPSSAAAGAASSTLPQCPAHGPMTFKEGTNKSGKPYAGYFCFAENCETTPVWQKTR